MSKAATPDELLLSAVQDLHAGAVLLATALPGLVRSVDDAELAVFLTGHVARLAAQAERLAATGRDVNGPVNLWMKGIVHDARRDTRSVEAGPLLDVALIGAIHKGLASEIVSYETAIALAALTEDALTEAAARTNRAEEIRADRELAERLAAILA